MRGLRISEGEEEESEEEKGEDEEESELESEGVVVLMDVRGIIVLFVKQVHLQNDVGAVSWVRLGMGCQGRRNGLMKSVLVVLFMIS